MTTALTTPAVWVLILIFAALAALALWLDHRGVDPFARLYGSDYKAPEDVAAWREQNWPKR